MLGLFAVLRLTCLAGERTWDGSGRSNQWTDNANWSGIGGAPDPGDDLRFPAGSFEFNTSNDFAGGTDFNKITWSGAGYTAAGNQVDLAAGIVVSHATGTTVVNLPISLAGIQTFDVTQAGASLTLNGAVNLGNRSLTITGSGHTTVAGGMSGFLNLGSVRKTGTGTLTISSNPSYSGNMTVDGGTLNVSGSLPNSTVIVNSGGTLRGTGPVDGITANSGATVRPGTTTFFASDLVSTDNVTLNAGSVLSIGLNGAGHGTGYGNLNVTGTVTLGGTLALSTTFTPPVGTTFTIIENDGSDDPVGTFAGLPDRSVFTVGGRPFRIYYGTRIGLARANDVTVEAVPALSLWDGGGGQNKLWSEPTNWVGDTLPLEGDDIQFINPGGGILLATNDFPAGRTFGSLILAGGKVKLDGNAAVFDGDIHDTAEGEVEINLPLSLGGGIQIDDATELTVTGVVTLTGNQRFLMAHEDATVRFPGGAALGGYSLTVENTVDAHSYAFFVQSLTGPGNLIKEGAGVLGAGQTSADIAVTINGGTLYGSNEGGNFPGPVVVNAGATLVAESAGDLTVNGGTVKPRSLAFTPAGTATFQSGVLKISLFFNSTQNPAIITHLALGSNSNVNLNGCTLALDISPSAIFDPGSSFRIVTPSGGASLTGTFTGLPDGAKFIEDGHLVTIAYDYQERTVLLTVDPPFVWDGGGSGNNWSTAGNWAGNIAPIPGKSLTFPAGVFKTSATNDFAPGTGFRVLTISGTGYIQSGNPLRLTEGLAQEASSGENTVSHDVQLSFIPVNVAGTGRLHLNGAVTGDSTPVKTGPGALRLGGSASNSTGWRVNEGELELAKSAATAISGNLFIGDGTVPARVSLIENHQIADTASVSVNAAARLDIGTNIEVINSLHGGGAVSLGGPLLPGRLTVNGGGFSGNISGTGFLTKSGSGALNLSGNTTFTGRTIVNEGTLSITGNHAQSDILLNGGTLRGTGRAGPISANLGGVVHPGQFQAGMNVMFSCGNVALNPSTVFLTALTGVDPGFMSQPLNVTGEVNLGSCALEVSVIFNPIAATGRQFVIIENDGTDAVRDTFAELPEGTIFLRDGIRWQVSYTGGSGNDVILSLLELLRPAISSTGVTTDGNFTTIIISGVAPERVTCELQASPDLVTWPVVRTMTATADGTFSFSYTPTAPSPRLYFRVRTR